MGTRKQAYLVGEGATQVEPGTEVAILDPMTGTTEVIPLGGGAAIGATFGDFKFDPSTVSEQALSPMWDELGFTSAPKVTRPMALADYNRLGVQPRLVRNPITGATYFRDLEGTLRHIPDPDAFQRYGFNWGDVANLNPDDFQRMGIGSPLMEAPPMIEPGVSRRRFPVSATPNYIREGPEGLRGLAIPAPRTMAALLPRVSAQTRDVILSALGLVGYSAGDISEELAYFTPRGSQERPRSALLA